MKTNFLNKLKQSLFLLLAILGTMVSYCQSSQNPTIEGCKTPHTGGFEDIGGRDSGGGLLNIGGKNTPGDLGIVKLLISTKTQYIFNSNDTSGTGKSSDTGQVNDPYDIGGRGDVGTGAIAITEIGGGKGTGSNDTGQITNPDDFNYDIGGFGTDSGTGLFASLDLKYLSGFKYNFDTGGRGGQGTSTGGDYNNHDDTGGMNSGGTTGEVYDLISF